MAAHEQGVGGVTAAAALWLVGVAVLAGWLWRETLRPLADVLSELDTPSPQQARWRLREVKEQLQQVRARESAAVRLLEDVALRLGEGLLVVGTDLKVRLVNPRALHFLGRETVDPAAMEPYFAPGNAPAIRFLEEAGHFVQNEAPARVNAAMLEWLGAPAPATGGST